MSGEYLNAQASLNDGTSGDEKYGLIAGKVIANCDQTRKGRVKVRLAARGGMEVWARVVVPDTGVYFIPQVNDEVLVGFHQGDGNEAFVIGRLWSDKNPPPRQEPGDPDNKRVIRTPFGHEIALDEKKQSVVITSGNGQIIEMKPEGIKITADKQDKATLSMDSAGNVKIEASTDLTLKAPHIYLDADNLDLGGKSSARIDGGSYCSINASMIYIG